MSDSIFEALKRLDPENDEHWTNEGLPRLNVIEEFTGAKIQRSELTELVPGFSRTNTVIPNSEDNSEDGAQPTTGAPWEPEGSDETVTPPEEDSGQENPPLEDGAQPDTNTGTTDSEPALNESQDGENTDNEDLSEKEIAEREHEEATKELVAAQQRVRKAEKELDAIIEFEEARDAGKTSMHDLQAFQKAQQEQRRRMIKGS